MNPRCVFCQGNVIIEAEAIGSQWQNVLKCIACGREQGKQAVPLPMFGGHHFAGRARLTRKDRALLDIVLRGVKPEERTQ